MKIFVPGAYTWGNKGDAALVTAFIDWLRSDLSATDVSITSFTPQVDHVHYAIPTHHMAVRPLAAWRRAADVLTSPIPPLRFALSRYRLAAARASYYWIAAWVALYRRTPLIARSLGRRSLWNLTKSIDECDLVFSVPGGYLLAPREIDDWWLYHVPNIYLGKALGKPVILGPSSIGPFSDGHKRAAARLLANVDLVVLREQYSHGFVSELGLHDDSILMSPDIAFLHKPRDLTEAGASTVQQVRALKIASKGVVGVSVRHHTFPGTTNSRELFERYLASVRDSLMALRADGASIVIVSQTMEDAPISNRMSQMLSARGVRHVNVDPTLSPSDLQALYGEFDLLIGTRMHANILALTRGTPVVAIAYEPKTMGILESIGLEDCGLWIENVGDGTLVQLAQRSWADRIAGRERVLASQQLIREEFARVARSIRTQFAQTIEGEIEPTSNGHSPR